MNNFKSRRHNSGKGGLIIILVILILFIFALSVYFFSRKNPETQLPLSLTEQEITQVPTQTIAEKPEIAQKQKEYVEKATSQKEWEVYENSKFSYKLKYNTSWTGKGDDNSPPIPSSANVTFSKNWADKNESCDLNILASITNDQYNSEIENLKSNKAFVEGQEILAGYQTTLFVNLGKTAADPMSYRYFLTKGNIYYQISYNRVKKGLNAETCNEVFNLMLSSLELTK
ncbi:hypothetical protein A2Y99_02185 [Candidatus Gottesmanbacteria bacterium RBG_13_37_7]|uniref:PsbP C-terminal domain-containing protein n=1 Tax=Candidatus Gottesmanbacteria bacterium RBG_13_37_7 TaxID=1798369 RepID=A0A1F5YIV6_9BACT|nr:MAG: hypothetical protein A2Y99_02185 [Candidatus Gottesmanbacteria bacterium RBG_13_37_7]